MNTKLKEGGIVVVEVMWGVWGNETEKKGRERKKLEIEKIRQNELENKVKKVWSKCRETL